MLEVIGAGLGRTGTHSLARALTQLGFGPCYTIQEVGKNPGHRDLWTRALDGSAVDWGSLYAGYRSAVEWPTVAFLPQVLAHFPRAKVVLTERDPDAWYESAAATIFPALAMSAHNPDPGKRTRMEMARRVVLERTFGGRYAEREHVLAVYRRHTRQVLELVPSERLLQFWVGEGWAPLCGFLGRPTPDIPFPRVNDRDSFLASAPEWARRMRDDSEGG